MFKSLVSFKNIFKSLEIVEFAKLYNNCSKSLQILANCLHLVNLWWVCLTVLYFYGSWHLIEQSKLTLSLPKEHQTKSLETRLPGSDLVTN